ncbi:MAG: hypothetical protein H0W68_00035 [Gemmatimonadaceae bacterium]|nr:hypothetical protein [Gemmatimonadaceae bacterium]
MIRSEEILHRFHGSATTTRWGASFFPVAVAVEILRECRTSDIAMIGIEGNEVLGNQVGARSDLIFDLSQRGSSSWSEFRDACNDEAEKVLKGLMAERDVMLWVTLMSAAEYRC